MGPDAEPRADADWLRTVADEVRSFDRSSTAERVAELLGHRVIDSDLPPGTRLSEEQLVEVLRVSRNTLRETVRLLTHESLLVHHLHRGVFVPELDEDDLVDLFRLRPLHDDVAAAEDAARRGDWPAVGTAALLDLLVGGECERAAKELEDYLHDSEAELLAAHRERPRSPA